MQEELEYRRICHTPSYHHVSRELIALQQERGEPSKHSTDRDGAGTSTTREDRDGRGRARDGCRAVGAVSRGSITSADDGEVGAGQSRGVAGVEDDAAVADEVADTGGGGGVEVEVGGREGAAGHVAVLACEIADLAGEGGDGVARRNLAALEGIQVPKGTGAVAVGGDGLVVDVVD